LSELKGLIAAHAKATVELQMLVRKHTKATKLTQSVKSQFGCYYFFALCANMRWRQSLSEGVLVKD